MPSPLQAFGDAVTAKLAVADSPSLTAAHEDLLPSFRKTVKAMQKASMVHPSMQQHYETMNGPKWRQALKDLPAVALAGGLGYGVGRALTEIIGEKTVGHIATEGGGTLRATMRPGWARAIPLAAAMISAGGAYAATRSREGMKGRREKASR